MSRIVRSILALERVGGDGVGATGCAIMVALILVIVGMIWLFETAVWLLWRFGVFIVALIGLAGCSTVGTIAVCAVNSAACN